MMPRPKAAIAVPCFLGGKVSSSTDCDSGCRPPPLRPCSTRKKMSDSRLVAMPQRSEVKVKPETQSISMRRRPKRVASHPAMGKMMAFDTRYEVTTHVPSSYGGAHIPRHVRDGNVDHGGVEHLHERGQHDRDGHDPGIDCGWGGTGHRLHKEHRKMKAPWSVMPLTDTGLRGCPGWEPRTSYQ